MSKKTVLPPKDGKIFVKMWNRLYPQLSVKKAFVPDVHLSLLEILCTLYQEQFELEEIIDLSGRTFETGKGRNGNQVRVRPEVSLLTTCRSQIKHYTSILDLGVQAQSARSKTASGINPEESKSWD